MMEVQDHSDNEKSRKQVSRWGTTQHGDNFT